MILALVAAAHAGDKASIEDHPGEGITLDAADSDASLRIGLWLEPALLVDGDAPSVQIALPRARLPFKATLDEHWTARLELAADDAKLDVGDVYAEWSPAKTWSFAAGRLRGPAGLDQAMAPRDLPLLDRGYVAAMGAERSLAVEGDLAQGPVHARLAVARGARDPDFDDDTNVDGLARVELRGDKHAEVALSFAALTRTNGAPGFAFDERLSPAKAYSGLAERLGADGAIAGSRARVLLDAAVLREGAPQTAGLSGHAAHLAGTALVGVSPTGVERDPAHDGAAPREGFELVDRAQFASTSLSGSFDDGAWLFADDLGFIGVISPRARAQFSATLTHLSPTNASPSTHYGAAAWLVVGL